MNRSRHIRMKLLLVAGDRTTNNARSVVSISGGLGRPFNHGLRGAQPLYHHWTVSRANCGYISLSPWPAHRNDLLVCCRRSTDTQHGGRGEVRELGKYVIAYKWEKMHKGLKWSLKKKKEGGVICIVMSYMVNLAHCTIESSHTHRSAASFLTFIFTCSHFQLVKHSSLVSGAKLQTISLYFTL